MKKLCSILVALAAVAIAITTAACTGDAPIPVPTAAAPVPVAVAAAGRDTAVAPATAAVDKPTATPAATVASAAATKSQAGAAPTAATVKAAANTKAAANEKIARPVGWSEASHSDQAEPSYDVVFPQDKVNQITITIAPESWAAMQANMTQLFGAPGTGRGGPAGGGPAGRQPPGGPQPPAGAQPPEGARPPAGQQPPAGGAFPGGGRGGPGGMGGNPDMTPVNPTWISATITFNGEMWTNVGVRYKGNSTLIRAWQSGSAKLPLKLDFDQFEEEFPAIKNQRFYGFKQLSLANNLSDASYLRDAVSYDIMEAAGLVTPETAFYEVFMDHGEGPVSLGLYTMVEVVDDTVIERAFADADGNIYEADGAAASLAAGAAGQIKASFQKENNKGAADWSDVEALHNVLHSAQRTTAPATWRASLEAVFNVDAFLEWLAVDAVIQDWDTYGAMNHNYYLYHDPTTDKLVWISWDHNEAMSSSGRGDISLDKKNVGANWPLIRYLLDDPVYQAKYNGYLQSTISDVFKPDELAKKYDGLVKLLRPYAEKAGGAQAFEAAVAQLKTFAVQRVAAVEVFLAAQK